MRSKFISHLIHFDLIISKTLRRGLQIKKLLVLRLSSALIWFICLSSSYPIYHHLLVEQIQIILTDAHLTCKCKLTLQKVSFIITNQDFPWISSVLNSNSGTVAHIKTLQLCYNLFNFITYPARVYSSSLGFAYQRWGDKLVIQLLSSVYYNIETT